MGEQTENHTKKLKVGARQEWRRIAGQAAGHRAARTLQTEGSSQIPGIHQHHAPVRIAKADIRNIARAKRAVQRARRRAG